MCFNLSGEIPQVAAYGCVPRALPHPLCFNLSGEIPQVAALSSSILCSISLRFQSLRRDSSSGRRTQGWRYTGTRRVSISQARFLKWPRLPVLLGMSKHSWFQSLRRDSSSGRIHPFLTGQYSASFNLSGEIPQVAAQLSLDSGFQK